VSVEAGNDEKETRREGNSYEAVIEVGEIEQKEEKEEEEEEEGEEEEIITQTIIISRHCLEKSHFAAKIFRIMISRMT